MLSFNDSDALSFRTVEVLMFCLLKDDLWNYYKYAVKTVRTCVCLSPRHLNVLLFVSVVCMCVMSLLSFKESGSVCQS